MENSNLKIVSRLLELSKNQIDYSEFPKECRKEHIYLANVLNDSVKKLEWEFAECFKRAVGNYKQTLAKGKKFGWFHKPEELVYIKMQINQLLYAIYGERFIHEIKFKPELKNEAYLDLINQIDRTVLMTSKELKKHNEEINKMAKEIMDEILREEKAESQTKS